MSLVQWIFLGVALLAGASLLMSVWGLYDDIVDIKLTHKSHQRLLQVALLRFGRDSVACGGEVVLLTLAVGVLFRLDRHLLGWILFVSLFDYPAFMLGLSIFDRILRLRRDTNTNGQATGSGE